MKEAAERIDSAVLFIVAGHPEKAAAQIARNRGAFESELRVEEGNLTEAGEKEAAADLRVVRRGLKQEYVAPLAPWLATVARLASIPRRRSGCGCRRAAITGC